MFKRIMKKLDAWADSKTQKEFNDIINTYIVFPISIIIGILILIADAI